MVGSAAGDEHSEILGFDVRKSERWVRTPSPQPLAPRIQRQARRFPLGGRRCQCYIHAANAAITQSIDDLKSKLNCFFAPGLTRAKGCFSMDSCLNSTRVEPPPEND
jgi:hypothetical protein